MNNFINGLKFFIFCFIFFVFCFYHTQFVVTMHWSWKEESWNMKINKLFKINSIDKLMKYLNELVCTSFCTLNFVIHLANIRGGGGTLSRSSFIILSWNPKFKNSKIRNYHCHKHAGFGVPYCTYKKSIVSDLRKSVIQEPQKKPSKQKFQEKVFEER